jgi:hypothetical protein
LGALLALYGENVLSEIVIGRKKRRGVLWWAEPWIQPIRGKESRMK